MPESIYHLEPGRYLLSQIYHNRGVAAGSIVPAVGSSIYDDTLGGSSFKEYTVTGHDDDDYAILEEVGGVITSQDRFISLADQRLLVYRNRIPVSEPTSPSALYYKVWIDWKLRVQGDSLEMYRYVLTTDPDIEVGSTTSASIISRSSPDPSNHYEEIIFDPTGALSEPITPIPPCYIQESDRVHFDDGPVWLIMYSHTTNAEIGRVRLQPTISYLSNQLHSPLALRNLVNIVPQYDGTDITGGSKTLTPAQVETALDPFSTPHFGCRLEYNVGSDEPVANVMDPGYFTDGGWLKMYGPDIPATPVDAAYPVVLKYFLPPHQWSVYTGDGGTNPGSTRFLTATFNIDLDTSGS